MIYLEKKQERYVVHSIKFEVDDAEKRMQPKHFTIHILTRITQ
jgi:hypothetical protein